MVDKLSLATSLRRTREKAGWTGDIVAKKLDMSSAAYRRYERGEVDPGASTILKLAEIYECSVDALVYRGGEGGEHGEGFSVDVGEEGSFQINISGVLHATGAEKKRKSYRPTMPKSKTPASVRPRKRSNGG